MSTACLGVLSVLQPIFYTVYCIFAYKTGYIAFPTRVLFWMPIVCALYYEPKNRYYLPIAAPIGAAVMAVNYGIYRLFPNEIYMVGSAFISTFFAIFTASCIALLRFLYFAARPKGETKEQQNEPFGCSCKGRLCTDSFPFYCILCAIPTVLVDLFIKWNTALFFAAFTLYTVFPAALMLFYRPKKILLYFAALAFQAVLCYTNSVILTRITDDSELLSLSLYPLIVTASATAAILAVRLCAMGTDKFLKHRKKEKEYDGSAISSGFEEI